MRRSPESRRVWSGLPAIRGLGLIVVACLGLATGCRGESGPTTPTSPVANGSPPSPPSQTPPSIPPSPPQTGSSGRVEGRIVATLTGQTVSGATVVVGDRRAKSDSAGRFALVLDGQPTTGLLDLVVTAPGFLRRDALVTWEAGGRSGVTIDIIEQRAPFELWFYRELARNGFEEPADLRPLRVWAGPEAPRFYVQLTDDLGAAIGDREVRTITQTIRDVVPILTGGRYSSVVIESGRDRRPPREGWIRVLPIRSGREFCGRATVGATTGTIELVRTGCGCDEGEKVTPGVVAHEVGHALGFWHVSEGLMNATPSVCRSGSAFSSIEVFHANVAYTRQRSNRDPDVDPKRAAFAHSADRSTTISCFVPRSP